MRTAAKRTLCPGSRTCGRGGLRGGGVRAPWTPPNSPAHLSLTVHSSHSPEAAVSAVPRWHPQLRLWYPVPTASCVRRVEISPPRSSLLFGQSRRPSFSLRPAPPRLSPRASQWYHLAPAAQGRVGSRWYPRACAEGSGSRARGMSSSHHHHHHQNARRLAEEAASTWLGGYGNLGGFPTKATAWAPLLLECQSRGRSLSVKPEHC